MVHHAAEAGDDAAVVQHAPAAAEEANRTGAHGQEVRLYDELLRRRAMIEPAAQAQILQAGATALFNTDQLVDAERAGAEAVAIQEGLGDPGALGMALVALAPIRWTVTRPRDSLAMSQRGADLLAADGDSLRHVWAPCYHGLLLTAVGRFADALPVAEVAVVRDRRLGRARLHLGDEGGRDAMLLGIATAAAVPHHQHVMMTYVCLVQELWRLGRYTEVEQRIREGCAYAQQRELANLNLQVDGLPFAVGAVHAKVRRDGYRAGGRSDRAVHGRPRGSREPSTSCRATGGSS